MKRYLTLLLLGLVILAGQANVVRGVGAARFGNGVLLLIPPDDNGGVQFMGELAPNGDYVIGTGFTGGIELNTQLYLWDLRQYNPDGPPQEPAPDAVFPLGNYHGQLGYNLIAIAPDSTRVALQLVGQIILLRLPELTLEATLPLDDLISFPGKPAWQGPLVGVVYDASDTVVVWNVASRAVYRREGVVAPLQIFALDTHWLIAQNRGFSICTLTLDTCQTYVTDQPVISVNTWQKMLVTGDLFANPPTPSIYWGLNEEDQSAVAGIDRYRFLKDDYTVSKLSPYGGYAVVLTWVVGNPTLPSFTIWDVDLQVAVSPTWYNEPVWLGDDHFYTPDGWSLYQTGDTEPLDTLDFSDISGSAGLDDQAMAERLRYYFEVQGVWSVTADGGWLVNVLGGTALVIPVIYEGG